MARRATKYERRRLETDEEAERFLLLFHKLQDMQLELELLEGSKKWTDKAQDKLISQMSKVADQILKLVIE